MKKLFDKNDKLKSGALITWIFFLTFILSSHAYRYISSGNLLPPKDSCGVSLNEGLILTAMIVGQLIVVSFFLLLVVSIIRAIDKYRKKKKLGRYIFKSLAYLFGLFLAYLGVQFYLLFSGYWYVCGPLNINLIG